MKSKRPNGDIPIPEKIAICPECGAAVVVDVYEIQQEEDGSWIVAGDGSGMHIQCTKEDSNHYQMPYVDWMPLDVPVARWLNDSYDFGPVNL